MGFLRIDESKCKKDGICVAECPNLIIRLKDENSVPAIVSGGEEACLICGHCVAVCPHGALSHTRVPLETCPSVEKSLVLDEKQAVQFLRSRRSIRVYKDKAVEKEKIQKLIEIARYAPTGSNSQLVKWHVVTDKEKMRVLSGATVEWMRDVVAGKTKRTPLPYMPTVIAAWEAGLDAVLRNAPALVVAYAPKEASNGMVDLTLTLSYFELVAPTVGLGTCWAGMLQGALLSSPELKKTLGLPAEYPHHYPMMLGYPKFKYHRLPERKPPKITWD
jgi:nitroreductase/NAD-dependent dihydropyrimidine dehydrogenase PreA subunit